MVAVDGGWSESGGVEMSKPDWSRAPDWASVLVQQNGFNGVVYCWASLYEDGARAIWDDDIARNWMFFDLRKCCWDFTEARP